MLSLGHIELQTMLYRKASLAPHGAVGPANIPQVTLALMGHTPAMDTNGCVIGSARWMSSYNPIINQGSALHQFSLTTHNDNDKDEIHLSIFIILW